VRRRRDIFPAEPRIYEHGHHLIGFRPVAWRLRPRRHGILSGIEGNLSENRRAYIQVLLAFIAPRVSGSNRAIAHRGV